MAERTDGPDTEHAPDLVNAASRALGNARAVLELVIAQVSLDEFRAPTEYQVYTTTRVSRAYVTDVIARYLSLAAAIDGRVRVEAHDVAGLSSDPDLVAAALARADEHWVAQSLGNNANETLSLMTLTPGSEEAELMLALNRAISRRIDAQGNPVMIDEDVDYRTLEKLVWRIAAELRRGIEQAVGDVDAADRVLTEAAKQFLGPRRRRPATPAERLAALLLEGGTDFGALLLAALGRAQPRLFCALIAARLRLATGFVLPALTQPERLALFLKATGLSDRESGTILAALAASLRLKDDRLVAIVDGYRSLSNRATHEMLRQMRLHPHYRAAIRKREKAQAAAR